MCLVVLGRVGPELNMTSLALQRPVLSHWITRGFLEASDELGMRIGKGNLKKNFFLS